MFNEWPARDTSKKIIRIQIQNGQKFGHLGPGQSGEGTEGAVSVASKKPSATAQLMAVLA